MQRGGRLIGENNPHKEPPAHKVNALQYPPMAGFPSADNLLYKGKYRIPSARLKDWDYASEGYYYVTICTKDRRCLFGNVVEIKEEPGAIIKLSDAGKILEKCWLRIPKKYPNVSLDTFQIMPNHLHGLIFIEERIEDVTLGLLMNQFKASCTSKVRMTGCKEFEWQSRFHDHIVRNEKDLERIRRYIECNPIMWIAGEDEEQR